MNGSERSGLWTYDLPGHLAVLVFFILSGYVIGLATKVPLTWATAVPYLKKRFIRLYPIYITGILLALLISDKTYSATEILSNALFLQRVTADPMYEIGVNWSLNYEVLFYILFIPISVYNINPIHIFFSALLFGLFFQLILPIQLLAMYGFGFCFWTVGLWLAKTDVTSRAHTSRYTLAGLLCVMLSFGSLNFIKEVMEYTLHTDTMRGVQSHYSVLNIMPSDFSYFPLGILLITYFTNKRIKHNKLLMITILATPLLYLLLQIYSSTKRPIDIDSRVVAYIFYLIGIILLFIESRSKSYKEKTLPAPMIKLGSISYGIYLIHFIIIILIGRIDFINKTNTAFILRTSVAIVSTIVAAYILERKLHPLVVKQLRKTPFFNTL